MLLDSLKYPLKHSVFGVTKEKLNILEPQADIDDTVSIQSCLYEKKKILKSQLLKPENQYVIVESHLTDKKKIWKDKLNSFQLNTLTTSLSKTFDQALISKEKGLTPFWTLQSKDISKKLWLPTKIDYVERIINDYSNGKIVVLNQEKTSPEKELVDDLISIVTFFSSLLLYGLRSHSIKDKIKKEAERKQELEDNQNTIISE